MSCSPFDLKDYFFEELTDPQRRQVEAHVKACPPCREEMERLNVTGAALLSVAEEEIPQRIAFVSDKIFEPSPWRRWWAGFWGSASRLGFASAAMLSTAIVVYALHPAKQAAPPVMTAALPAPAPVIQTVSETEIQARIDKAVSKAFTEAEGRQDQKTQMLVSELKGLRQQMVVASSVMDLYQKKEGVRILQANQYGDPQHEQDQQ